MFVSSKLLRGSLRHAIKAPHCSRTFADSGADYESIKERIKSGNAFKLFQLEERLKIDEKKLKREMHNLQRIFHPDKIMSQGREPTNLTNNLSTIVNQAYLTLKDPYTRAKYLLEVKLNKSPDAIEMSLDQVKLDPQFLSRMMETQEQINLGSGMQLFKLKAQIDAEISQLTSEIEEQFERRDYGCVLDLLGKLQFLARCHSALRKKTGDDL